VAASVVPIVVTEDWTVPDGSETPTGEVDFLLSDEIASPTYVSPRLVVCGIDQGALVQQLVANDLDSTGAPLVPAATTYRIRERINGATDQTYFAVVPAVPPGSRSVVDASTADGSNVITSVTAAFTGADVGAYVLVANGTAVPVGAQIVEVQTSTTAVLSATATESLVGASLLVGASVRLSDLRVLAGG
jgi:hypothetical protein